MSEFQLYGDLEKFLIRQGYKTMQEVKPHPTSSRRVDVVGIKPRLKKTVVIEAKLSDYSRVLKQGMNGLFISDLVYISAPYQYAQTIIRKHERELQEVGIGLIGVNGKAVELIKPKQSVYVEENRKNSLIEMTLQRRKLNDKAIF